MKWDSFKSDRYGIQWTIYYTRMMTMTIIIINIIIIIIFIIIIIILIITIDKFVNTVSPSKRLPSVPLAFLSPPAFSAPLLPWLSV